ncbi:MAG: hypothetical protein AAFN10_18475 [Bacteroidota bacterium]
MKRLFKRISLGILGLLLLAIGSLVISMLNPQWFYDYTTERGNFRILHDQAFPEGVDSILNQAHLIVQKSPHYLADYPITICMDDGSSFPRWIEKLKKGRAVSYAHIVVMQQAFDYEKGASDFDGHLWDLTELYAHEITHCYQFKLAGFATLWLPMWKIEGYAEYNSRQVVPPFSLRERYALLLHSRQNPKQGFHWAATQNGYGSPESYLEALVYVQYLLEEENWTYPQILESEIEAKSLEAKLKAWYKKSP